MKEVYPLRCVLQILSLTVALLTLSYASYLDVKSKMVQNKVWIAPFTLGIALMTLKVKMLLLLPEEAYMDIVAALSLAYLLHRFRILGGADCKAIILTSILAPTAGRSPLLFPATLTVNFFILLGAFSSVRILLQAARGEREVYSCCHDKADKSRASRGIKGYLQWFPPAIPIITISFLVSFFFGNMLTLTFQA
ncbi:MAG: prepilin peptidase [Candidatus Freyarchaeota archaeon]